MKQHEQPSRPTLAQKLGDVTHVSPLLRKIRQLSGCAEHELLPVPQPKVFKLAGSLLDNA